MGEAQGHELLLQKERDRRPLAAATGLERAAFGGGSLRHFARSSLPTSGYEPPSASTGPACSHRSARKWLGVPRLTRLALPI